jgi:hypothetical protein
MDPAPDCPEIIDKPGVGVHVARQPVIGVPGELHDCLR